MHAFNRCRLCGATSYRPVIDRDATGALRPTGLYRCSGCSVVFADPAAWRDGTPAAAAPSAAPRAPDLRTYGGGAPGAGRP